MDIRKIHIGAEKKNKALVMLCQLNWDNIKYEKKHELCFVKNNTSLKDSIGSLLNVAQKNNVDVVLMPELAIPESFLPTLFEFSKENDIYIIAGTHYKNVTNGYKSVCPVVLPQGVYFTDKIHPAPAELSSFPGEGLVQGDEVVVFEGTKIGNFAVTICADFLSEEIKNAIGIENIDVLFLPAFMNHSEMYYARMQNAVENSSNGLYILYSNFIQNSMSADGKSALFACCDRLFLGQWKERKYTDLKPLYKVYQMKNDSEYAIFEIDLVNKKPLLPRNLYTKLNVMFIDDDTISNRSSYNFLQLIGNNNIGYKLIDDLFVEPNEYLQIKKSLEEKNIVLIIGDPGIGKTYTAVKLLHEYYKEGYKPIWVMGMSKEDRELQSAKIMNYEPNEREIVYFEDPFGRTQFERRDDVLQIFLPLLDRIKNSHSKLIVTSRSTVFQSFKNEVPHSELMNEYVEILNIQKPSYSKAKLKQIYENLCNVDTNNGLYEKWRNAIYRAIDRNQLITPIMINQLAGTLQTITTDNQFWERISLLKSNNLLMVVMNELKMLSVPSRILLFIMFLHGRYLVKLSAINEEYSRTQHLVKDELGLPFMSLLSSELTLQKSRIEKIGTKKQALRFVHPMYEEAIGELIQKDVSSLNVFMICFKSLVLSSVPAYVLLLQMIKKTPNIAKQICQNIDFLKINITTKDRMKLFLNCSKSKDVFFVEFANNIYSQKQFLKDLYDCTFDYSLIQDLFLILKKRIINGEVDYKKMCFEKILLRDRIDIINPEPLFHFVIFLIGIVPEVVDKIIMKDSYVYGRKYIMHNPKYRKDTLKKLAGLSCFALFKNIEENVISEEKSRKLSYRQLILKLYDERYDNCKVYIDDGTIVPALKRSKIYLAGVIKVEGKFQVGDIIKIVNVKGEELFKAMMFMASEKIDAYKGMHSQDIIMFEGLINTFISKDSYRILTNQAIKKSRWYKRYRYCRRRR